MLRRLYHKFVADTSGQDLTEYALIIALIVIALVAAITFLGLNINSIAQGISKWLAGLQGK